MDAEDQGTIEGEVAVSAPLAPIVWLLGKVQSGKTSIIRELTRASDAEIGSGFKACTKTARVFDFPSDAPILKFLDTRGLGERGYDPTEDLMFCEGRSHLILAVARAMDGDQSALIEALRAIRKRQPDWPVVVAQTTLHEGYATGQAHLLPYPFSEGEVASTVPRNLAHGIAYQRELFRSLPGSRALAFVPLDFTREEDGFAPSDYGREALVEALIAAAPAALSVALAQLPAVEGEAAVNPADAYIVRFALAAGASDVLPAAGLVGVPMVQSAMLVYLAKQYGVDWNARSLAEFAGALGVGALVRVGAAFGLRQLVKLIPGYGQTVGAVAAASASFATTYAVGKAAAFFLAKDERERKAADVAEVYRRSLAEAFHLAKSRRPELPPASGAPTA